MTSVERENINKGFSQMADQYEYLSKVNPIVRSNRNTVYRHIMKFLSPEDKILELNGGSGQDAEYLASKGYNIHSTDFSDNMFAKLYEKSQIFPNLTVQQLSYYNLSEVENQPYDYIFSNLGGFNLSPNLKSTFGQIPNVLEPGGFITMVILSKVCIWEIFNLIWDRKVAFRRIPSWLGHGVQTNVANAKMTTYYHSIRSIKNWISKEFQLLEIQGLSVFIPPSYFESFPRRLPRVFNLLKKLDKKLSKYPPFNILGDFSILTFRYVPSDVNVKEIS